MKGAEGKPLLVLGERGRVARRRSSPITFGSGRAAMRAAALTRPLRRLAHRLMKEPDLEEEMLKATSRGQTLNLERRSIKDDIEPATVTAPSGKEETLTLDKAEPELRRKSMIAGEQGVYRISSGKLASVVTVGNANAKELSAATATDAALSPILNETGGGSFWLGRNQADASPLPRIVMVRGGHVMHGADWLGLHKRDAYHSRGATVPAFTGFLALALLLGMMAITWFREGHCLRHCHEWRDCMPASSFPRRFCC